MFAPVVLFVYNRPYHTRQTVEALQRNELAQDSELLVFSDGPKDEQSAVHVQEVRRYIRSLTGFKNITIIERDRNWGLAASIIDAVTDTVNQFGRIIVLEDDIVTSPFFLRFMNDALELYRNIPKVMHVSGYNYPIDIKALQETFFFRGASCWGWGTWDRAWKYFEKDCMKLIRSFSFRDKYRLNYDGTAAMWSQVVANREGRIDTWAVFWYTAIFKQKGLCLHPAISMTRNIGHDGSGEHCQYMSVFSLQYVARSPIVNFESVVAENTLAVKEIKGFYKNNKEGLSVRAIKKILRLLRERVSK